MINMPRPIVAIAAGFFTSVFLVMTYQLVFVVVLFNLDPAYRQAEASSLALPGNLIAFTLIADVCCAVVGGLVTARIARDAPSRPVYLLAAMHFIGSLASVMTDPSPMYPWWVHATRAIASLLALLTLGWMADRVAKNANSGSANTNYSGSERDTEASSDATRRNADREHSTTTDSP